MHSLRGGNRVGMDAHGEVESQACQIGDQYGQELIKQTKGHNICALGVVLLHGQLRISLATYV